VHLEPLLQCAQVLGTPGVHLGCPRNALVHPSSSLL